MIRTKVTAYDMFSYAGDVLEYDGWLFVWSTKRKKYFAISVPK